MKEFSTASFCSFQVAKCIMSATRQALKFVDTRSKYSVYGFNREASDKFKCNIPIPITNVCLLYYFINDNWDKECISSRMEIDEKENCCSMTYDEEDDCNTAFLKKVFCSGIHQWRFKIRKVWIDKKKDADNWTTTIGLCPQHDDYSAKEIADDGLFVTQDGFGFGYQIGKFVLQFEGSYLKTNYGKRCVENDIIEMIADCDKGKLSYKINGIDYGQAFTLEKGQKYRAAVNLDKPGDSIQLL